MQSQTVLLFSVVCALVFALITITVVLAKIRSKAFIRQIKALALGNEPAIRVKNSRGGYK